MLTQTTECAIETLVYLVLDRHRDPISPRRIARDLNRSPTYLAKVTGLLVKAGILRAHRGALGGVTLGREPADIALLEIVEACQGRIIGDYCQDDAAPDDVCAFHAAMLELHEATLRILSRWTLADLASRPAPSGPLCRTAACRLANASRKRKRHARR